MKGRNPARKTTSRDGAEVLGANLRAARPGTVYCRALLPAHARRAREWADACLAGTGAAVVETWADLRGHLAAAGAGAVSLGDPFVLRDIRAALRGTGIEVRVVRNDTGLFPPGAVRTKTGTPYRVFGPFRRRAEEMLAAAPPPAAAPGRAGPARREALRALAAAGRVAGRYAETRDDLARATGEGTTALSRYLARGVLGPWEVLAALPGDSPVVPQLLWREFFRQLDHDFPEARRRGLRADRRGLAWRRDAAEWRRLETGRTGFPLVDAGVRQLLAEGVMHNRARMVVAQFATKDLLADWRRGERFFARHLADYDPAVNAGNWAWNAGAGTDPEVFGPRVFNPWTQARRFDPRGEYVRRWVPELRDVPTRDLLRPGGAAGHGDPPYPPPVVDHDARRKAFLEMLAVGR